MSTLYINENGRTTCVRHGGFYLQCEVEAHPTRTNHDTSLDNWERLTADTIAEFDLHCETCGGL